MPDDHIRRLGAFLVMATPMIVGVGCHRASNGSAAGKSPSTTVPRITVVMPQRATIAKIIEQPGTVEAFEQTVLYAKIAGYAQKVNVDIGQRVIGPKLDDKGQVVTPGDVLVEIAVPELEEEANQKVALIKQSEAQIVQSRKSLVAAEANVAAIESGVNEALAAQVRSESLHKRWSSEAERQAGLVERGVIDSQTAEETENQLGAAAAGLAEAKARVVTARAAVIKAIADRDKAEADVNAAIAHCEVCKAEHRRLQAMLAYTKIRAPYDGVITRRAVSTGDYLQAGSAGNEGILTIAQLDPARVIVYVPEADSPLVREGTPIELDFQSAGAGNATGTISRTSWSLDPGSRTLRVEIDVPNSDGHLRAGTYVFARLKMQMPEEWTLPLTAVVKQGDSMVAFRVNDRKVVRTPIKVGSKDPSRIQILQIQDVADPTKWTKVSGNETFADIAAGLSNEQMVEVSGNSK